ncbi:hypothetical protein QYF36_017342 [Acer negundo]|nr:hypothetical protein QYF36_017342 [Acer negundo]
MSCGIKRARNQLPPQTTLKSQVLADFIAGFTPSENVQAEQELVDMTKNVKDGKWTLSIDGSSNIKGSGLAEYEALIAGLDLAKSLNIKKIQVQSDSQLVVRQMTDSKDRKFKSRSISRPWVDNVKRYQINSRCPSHVPNYTSRRIFDTCRPWEELDGSHTGLSTSRHSTRGQIRRQKSQSKSRKVLYHVCGILLANDAYGLSEPCKVVRQMPKIRANITSCTRQTTRSSKRHVYMLVLTDYFTKWVEIGAFRQVRDIEVRNFVWRNIICRFGIPREIVTDNGSQFISYDFKNLCDKYGIKLSFSTPRYPQANGQAESTNKTIINSLKKRSEAKKGQRAEKLPEILWSYRTTPRRSTGEMLFSLVYGSESMIPVETRLPTTRSKNPNEEQNSSELSFELDHLDERRERAAIQIQSYQQQVARHYNKKV